MKFQKGDKVVITAIVQSGYYPGANVMGGKIVGGPRDTNGNYRNGENVRTLVRFKPETAWEGIIVGYSHRVTGVKHGGFQEAGWLENETRYPVILVQPILTQRWLKPLACLEEDIELIREGDDVQAS